MGTDTITSSETSNNTTINQASSWASAGVITFGVVLCALMCIASCHIHQKEPVKFWLDFSTLIFGIACGWLIGTILSPTVKEESERFVKIGTAIGSFISGYVLSKVDPLASDLVKVGSWNIDSSLRLLMWITGTLAATMTIYALRAYYLPSTAEEIKESKTQNSQTPPKIVE